MKKSDLIKIIREEINELKHKGDEVLYQLKTKAKTEYEGSPGVSKVFITQGKPVGKDNYGGKILSIDGTPGAWYVHDLLSDGKPRNTIQIYGRDWICTNFGAILKEVKQWLKKNENVHEGQLVEGKAIDKISKDINKWYSAGSDVFPDIEQAMKEFFKEHPQKKTLEKMIWDNFHTAVRFADDSFGKLDAIVKYLKKYNK